MAFLDNRLKKTFVTRFWVQYWTDLESSRVALTVTGSVSFWSLWAIAFPSSSVLHTVILCYKTCVICTESVLVYLLNIVVSWGEDKCAASERKTDSHGLLRKYFVNRLPLLHSLVRASLGIMVPWLLLPLFPLVYFHFYIYATTSSSSHKMPG